MKIYFSLFLLVITTCFSCQENYQEKTKDKLKIIKSTNKLLNNSQRNFFIGMDSLTNYYCSCNSLSKPQRDFDFYFYFYLSKTSQTVKNKEYYRYGYKYYQQPSLMDVGSYKQFIRLDKDTLSVAYYIDDMNSFDSALIEKKLWVFGKENVIKKPKNNTCLFFGEMIEYYHDKDDLYCFGTFHSSDLTATSHTWKEIKSICISPRFGILSFQINVNGKLYDCFTSN